jgi:hypothetical protein
MLLLSLRRMFMHLLKLFGWQFSTGSQEAWAVHWRGNAQQDGTEEGKSESERDSDDSESDEQPPPRIVTRICTEDKALFLLHCTCEFPTQHLLPCRHILCVDVLEGHAHVPLEQVHFRWTTVHNSGLLVVERYVCSTAYHETLPQYLFAADMS